MKLTGPEIRRRIVHDQTIVIAPFDETNLNPNSYNLSLDRKLVVYDREASVQRAPGSTTYSMDLATVLHRWNAERDAFRRGFRGVPPHSQFNPHPELAQWDNVLDMKAENPVYELDIPDEGLVLIPGRLYLAQTVEYTETHDLVPCIDGRSSVGRLGLSIHATAGFGDVGFCGTWTLEMNVVEPLRIYPFVKVCQISYEPVVGSIVPYNSTKYQGQRVPRPSGLWKELQHGEASAEPRL